MGPALVDHMLEAIASVRNVLHRSLNGAHDRADGVAAYALHAPRPAAAARLRTCTHQLSK